MLIQPFPHDSKSEDSYKDIEDSYRRHVNPQWAKLLNLLGMNKQFVNCKGVDLYDSEGKHYLDYLSGYGVYNVGHNHPKLVADLVDQLQSNRPTMLQSDIPELAAKLSKKLCDLAGGKLTKVFFTSTGSEGVETAIKFSRCYTKRDGILYADGGFHGLTYGALSLMSNTWWKEGFGSTLPNTKGVPFGEIKALEQELASKKYAAFIMEPVQGESGIKVPSQEFMQEAQRLCKKYGTLFVLDEVQTGMFRTGRFLAAHHFNIEPDMVILAKAMSGAFVPVGAVLMNDAINASVYSSVDKAFVHASTFGENALAMRAGLSTLEVIEQEGLAERCLALGDKLRAGVNKIAENSEFISECRGLGLMNGIVFKSPNSMKLKMLYASFRKLHPGLFGQMIVKTLFERSGILTQICGHNYDVVKAVPPLVASEADIDAFIDALRDLDQIMNSLKSEFWSQGVKIGMKAISR